MEPYTASVLQMKKSNSIKDLVAIHGYFRNNQIIYYVEHIHLSRCKSTLSPFILVLISNYLLKHFLGWVIYL